MLFRKFGMIAKLTFVFGLLGLCVSCGKPSLSPEARELLGQLEANGDLIVAAKIKGELPLDPIAVDWNTAKSIKIPLVSQISVIPRARQFRRMDLDVRALYNEKEIGLLLEWLDPTRDESEVKTQRFRDAVAVALPMNFGEGILLPYIGMGNKDRPINIWHWKASWQADIERGYQGVQASSEGMVPNNNPQQFLSGAQAGSPLSQQQRTSPVENLLAEGFGTLTSSSVPDLNGKGSWEKAQWRVVITRPLKASENAADLTAQGLIPITFAVWDGATAERNGIKGVTRWRFLQLPDKEVAMPYLRSLVPSAGASGNATRGKELVAKFGCIQCHNLPGRSAINDVGPDLTRAGAIHRAGYLLESMKEPNTVIVPAPGYYDPTTMTSTMPSYEGAVQEQDYLDIVEYLGSLK